ncbi:MAG: superoxide dismutase, partial [Anaerolineae bacterium]|nr:superoxide dismutase [Anaerolineae bacterium]
PGAAVETISFSDNYLFEPGGFNSNGIVATANGRWLIIANSGAQMIYRVDPTSGTSAAIDLGGDALPNGDGLVLFGHTLYVVQNRSNQIAVVELAADYMSGSVVATITDANFRVPTTAAAFGNALYAVNARFGTPPGPDVEYEIVRVRR